MATNEYAVDKKGYFMLLKMEHVEKMRTFYNAPTSASPSAMIGWMCDDFLADVKLPPDAKRRIAEAIRENKARRAKKRAEWHSSDAFEKDRARRKRLRDSGKSNGESKKNGGV